MLCEQISYNCISCDAVYVLVKSSRPYFHTKDLICTRCDTICERSISTDNFTQANDKNDKNNICHPPAKILQNNTTQNKDLWDNLQKISQDYEARIKKLEDQVDSMKKNHEKLESGILTIKFN